MNVLAPILIGLAYVAVVSSVPEPRRRTFNALFVAGAGAAYLSSGALGPWELVFTAAITPTDPPVRAPLLLRLRPLRPGHRAVVPGERPVPSSDVVPPAGRPRPTELPR